ncbi:MAG: type II toxin-antitoxin system RelE/ParE family toxin, partial [Myxococcota bacterium]
ANDTRKRKSRKNLAWTVDWDPGARKDLRRLDQQIQKRITQFLQSRLASVSNPKQLGEPLVGKQGMWRYRVGDYRIVCLLDKQKCTIVVLRARHRREVYK